MQNPLEVPIAQMQAALTKLQPQIIRKMGALAIEFTRENFAKQGFQGDSFEVWPQRKKTSKKDTGRLVLIKTAHLLNATRVVMYTGDSVTIGNNMPYAAIHNDGGSIPHAARNQMLYFKVSKTGQVRFAKSKTAKQRAAAHDWYNASISAHITNIPRRHFLGDSPVLRKRIQIMILQEAYNYLTNIKSK